MKSGVNKFIASAEDANKAAKVELSDGQIIEADVVIMGVGVSPATGFLKDSGFTLERDGGVRVDEFLRVPGLQNVYAIGKSSNHIICLL
jgi:NAD(P)H-nitrite reductase large subunit